MKTKRSVWFKALSVFLATLMFVQILPLSVLANEATNYQALEETVQETVIADIQCELTDEKTSYSNTYLLVDGTYASVISANQIGHHILTMQYSY